MAITPNPFCPGATLSLSTGAVSGATYNWVGPNTFASGLQNPTITGASTAAAGIYSLSITRNGCTSVETTFNLNAVSGAASAPAMVAVKNPTSTSLTAVWKATPGVALYTIEYRIIGSTTWAKLGPLTPSVESVTFNRYYTIMSLQAGTTYEVRVTGNLSGCLTATSGVLTGTTTAPTGTCKIPTGIFSDNIGDNTANIKWTPEALGQCTFVSYGPRNVNPATWTTVSVPTPGGLLSLSGLTPGLKYGYRLRTNCTAGCPTSSAIFSAISAIQEFTTTNSGVKVGEESVTFTTLAEPTMSVYPNPNKGAFTLQMENFNGEATTVQILDMTGRVIIAREVSNGETSFDLTDNAKGIYLIKAGDKAAKIIVD